MEKGKIGVQTENIFPIIKKFLYSEQEIFIRELVSNAVDASKKLKKLASLGTFKGELGDLSIEVIANPEKNELTIKDRGVGMSATEVKKYINQIAFSGAKEFVEKFQKEDDKEQLIGNFGLGFYSAFMVSSEVTILSKSFNPKAKGVKWVCDGTTEFSMEEYDKEDRGTEIILKLNDDAKEFTEKTRLQNILNRFCRFLPIPVKLEGEQINETDPIWIKQPTDLKDTDYQEFYKKIYPFSEPPLFWIHLNVDYPFNLTGILYFPKLKSNFEPSKNKIQLYSRQVFVTDHVEGVVPDFLTYLHGVIDSPDIPLNVSRSYLQGDPNVKKINNHITKKVADKLSELFKADRKAYEEKWSDIGVFVKYGIISEPKFEERAKNIVLLKNIEGAHFTTEELKTKIADIQTDKNKKLIFIYTDNPEGQHTYIEAAKKYNYEVIEVDRIIDQHFISHLERKEENVSFVRVDADTPDKLVEKEDNAESVLNKDEEEKLKKIFEDNIQEKEMNASVRSLSPEDEPVKLVKPEWERRMKEMAAQQGGMDVLGGMPDKNHLVINANHPIMGKVLVEPSAEKQKEIISYLYDLALLSQNELKGEKLSSFLKKSLNLIK
ncbi:MAG: molecular chaperone HtpG [Chitinophagaceae bacterium]|nr:MAG: molecular chaperone HtpG [Chitinophagaceae bacterium]